MSNQFNSNGRILFEGKSNIDGENIVVIITGLDNKTSNKIRMNNKSKLTLYKYNSRT